MVVKLLYKEDEFIANIISKSFSRNEDLQGAIDISLPKKWFNPVIIRLRAKYHKLQYDMDEKHYKLEGRKIFIRRGPVWDVKLS